MRQETRVDLAIKNKLSGVCDLVNEVSKALTHIMELAEDRQDDEIWQAAWDAQHSLDIFC